VIAHPGRHANRSICLQDESYIGKNYKKKRKRNMLGTVGWVCPIRIQEQLANFSLLRNEGRRKESLIRTSRMIFDCTLE